MLVGHPWSWAALVATRGPEDVGGSSVVLAFLCFMLRRLVLLLRHLPHADEHANENKKGSEHRTLVLGRWDARSARINRHINIDSNHCN